MVYRNKREQGGRLPVDLRLGSTVEKLGGLDLDKDAAAISDGRFRTLYNIRRTAGGHRERGGQLPSNNTSYGAIEGFVDTSDLGAVHAGTAMTLGGDAGDYGRYLFFLGRHSDGFHTVLLRWDTLDQVMAEAIIGPSTNPALNPYYSVAGLIKGVDKQVYTAGGFVDPVGSGANNLSRVISVNKNDQTTVTIESSVGPQGAPGEPGFVSSMIEDPNAPGSFFAGRRYTGIGPSDGKIYRDGVLEDTPVFVYGGTINNVVPWFGALDGKIHAGWGLYGSFVTGGVTNTIRKRTSAGVWANLTLPAAPYGQWAAQGNPSNFGGVLLVPGFYHLNGAAADYNTAILAVTAAGVVTLARRVTSPTVNISLGTAIFDGKFHYLHTDNVISYCALGSYDGTTWNDSIWDCMIDGERFLLLALRAANGALWAIGQNVLAGPVLDKYWLLRSNGANTSIWTKYRQITPASIASSIFADIVAADL